MSKTFVLDAGHYGKYNQSPVVKDYYEAQVMWKLTNYQKQYLLEYEGVKVVLTRTVQKKDLDLISRGKMAKKGVVFISNHSNACGTESVNYALAIAMRDNSRVKYDDISQELAERLVNTIADVMGVKANFLMKAYEGDRDGNGLHDDEWYGVLQGAKMVGVPAMILEHSFHTNKAAAKWLLKDANLKKLAKAEVKTLAAYYGLKKKATTTTSKKPVSPVDYAEKFDEHIKGAYKVIAKDGLHLRKGAAASKDSIRVMPYGSTVQCYGYYTGDWYLVVDEKNRSGFCHSAYLKEE